MPLIPSSPGYDDGPVVFDATPPLPAACAVGIRHFHATDPAREDISAANRQFMVSVFYPAKPNEAAARARLTDIFAPKRDEALELLAQGEELTADQKETAFARLRALALRAQRGPEPIEAPPHPVLIYYPGGVCHRLSNAALCEQLAAAGYVVLALDAPRDAPVVVFPDGTLVPTEPDSDEDYIWPRVADVRFLLDHLGALEPFTGPLDVSRIGMFGHSRGGYLSNICAVEDSRIKAAVNMDGFLWGLWTEGTGLDQYAPDFQARARALQTPILRLRGDQGSEAAAKRGFEAEAADFGGDFIFIALSGYGHGSFSTPWMNGMPENFSKSAGAEPAPQRTALLASLLMDFFATYLLNARPRIALLEATGGAMQVFSRRQP